MTVPCRSCGAEATMRFDVGDVNRRLSGDSFRYFECGACRLLFLEPVPADLSRYYPLEYYGGPPSRDRLLRAAALERYKIELVRQYVSAGRLLEVGPSYGAFAHLAKEAGFEVDTIEIDPDCCRFLADTVGVSVVRSGEPERVLADRAGEYDVIAMWHNLEHVPAARELFSASARALRQGGVLIVAAPNPDAFQFRIFGRRWTHLDAPRHVVLMPIPLIEEWGRTCGLVVEDVTTTDEGSLGWNTFGWRESLAAFFMGRYARFAARLAGSVLALLAGPLERAGRRGATYTAVFRRG